MLEIFKRIYRVPRAFLLISKARRLRVEAHKSRANLRIQVIEIMIRSGRWIMPLLARKISL